jgi:hypothetical protein
VLRAKYLSYSKGGQAGGLLRPIKDNPADAYYGQTLHLIHLETYLSTPFSSKFINGPNKLEFYILLDWKGFPRDKH